jgi:hypothetical protein
MVGLGSACDTPDNPGKAVFDGSQIRESKHLSSNSIWGLSLLEQDFSANTTAVVGQQDVPQTDPTELCHYVSTTYEIVDEV